MKKLTHTLLGLLAIIACAGATSCKKGTYLEVVFKGAALPPVNRIYFSLTLPDKTVAQGPLPPDYTASTVVKLPASAAFQLDDHSGQLVIAATAYDAAGTVLGMATTSTTIMHGETWTVDVDFSPGAVTDAGADATTDAGDDGSLVTITDGSIDSGGCVAATVEATESLSVDYNSSGSDTDTGNMLWAYVGPAEQYVGWMKFGVRFVPKSVHLTKASLNLFLAQAPTGLPTLSVAYSAVDGWTRSKSKAGDISNDGVVSTGGPYTSPNPMPASTPYALDVTGHNWALDVQDGFVTLGIQNVSLATTAVASKVVFYGVNHAASPDPTRPTLDLEFCP